MSSPALIAVRAASSSRSAVEKAIAMSLAGSGPAQFPKPISPTRILSVERLAAIESFTVDALAMRWTSRTGDA